MWREEAWVVSSYHPTSFSSSCPVIPEASPHPALVNHPLHPKRPHCKKSSVLSPAGQQNQYPKEQAGELQILLPHRQTWKEAPSPHLEHGDKPYCGTLDWSEWSSVPMRKSNPSRKFSSGLQYQHLVYGNLHPYQFPSFQTWKNSEIWLIRKGLHPRWHTHKGHHPNQVARQPHQSVACLKLHLKQQRQANLSPKKE